MASSFRLIPALSGSQSGSHVEEFKHERLGILLRAARECGALGRVRLRGRDVVVASAPESAHEVLVEKARAFEKSPGTRFMLYPLAGEGLLTARGDLWRRQRRVMAPLFTHSQIAGFAGTMAEAASRSAARMRDGEIVEVARATTQIAMAVVGRALFDAETFDDADELGAALTVALAWADSMVGSWPMFLQLGARKLIGTLRDRCTTGALRALGDRMLDALEMPAVYYLPRQRPVREAVATIDRRIERMIAARRAAGPDRQDFLAQLLRARDEQGRAMSEKQVRDEAVTLFSAGHETTALGLAWAFQELARRPALYDAVVREADGLNGVRFAGDALPALPRCLAVFKEALRMYPPAYIAMREAKEHVVIAGHELPQGTIVVVSIYGIHHHPEVYSNPETFDPDRFAPQAEAARPRAAFLPFGAGPRVCIGNHFALLEGQIVLATLSRAVRFEPAGPPARPAPMATLRPSTRIPMTVRRRPAEETRAAS